MLRRDEIALTTQLAPSANANANDLARRELLAPDRIVRPRARRFPYTEAADAMRRLAPANYPKFA